MYRTLALALGLCALAIPVNAQPWGGTGYSETHSYTIEHRGFGWGRDYYRPRYQAPDPGSVVGGFIGGIFGGWLSNRMSQPPPEPERESRLKPFTPDWYTYCENKYKSFDAKTGYYTSLPTYVKRFCEAD